jgi:phosphoribosylaminoimidazole-succinocarboxamide synthase
MPAATVYRTQLSGLTRIHEGKVRDIYAIDEATLLIVTTDRLSAFDVVLPDPIPGKGEVLNGISNFWFERTQQLVPNHLSGRDPASVARSDAERALLAGRAVIVGARRRCPSRRWCAATPLARGGRTTRRAAGCAASPCRRACARRSARRSRCSRRRPRRRGAR